MKHISESTIKGIKYYIVRVGKQSKTFSTKKYGDSNAKKMAQRYRDELVHERNIYGIYQYTSEVKYTVEYAFNRSLELYVHTLSTRNKHELMFNKYFKNYFTRELCTIRARDIVEHLNGNLSESQGCLSRIKTLWNQIFKAGIMDERVLTNYADVVELPRSNKIEVKRDKFATIDEVQAVIAELSVIKPKQNAHARMIAALIVYAILIIGETGMRPAECYALTRSDIDFDKKIITFGNRIGSDLEKENIVVKPKTSNAMRTQPITNVLDSIFKSFFEYQPRERLFELDNGVVLNSDIVATRLGRVNKKLGTSFNMYKLRHNFARDLINSDLGNKRTVMDLMGHASYGQSLDYTHSTVEQQRELLESVRNKKEAPKL